MAAKYVLPEDQEKYAEFVKHHFFQLASRRPFVPLHHYTSGANLISIIKSGEFWATQIACMNDSKELIHAIDLLQNAISERERLGVTDEFAILLAKMRKLLTGTSHEIASPFVICFSERGDDLSQWRAYGGSEGGYAIEFDTKILLDAAVRSNAYLLPVTYDDDAKAIIFTDILKWTETYFMDGLQQGRAPSLEDWADEFAFHWLDSLSYLAPIFKHPTFRDEVEWRWIYLLAPGDVKNLQFIERHSMMTRHLPMKLSEPDANGYNPLPIESIMVGPKFHQRLSQISVGDLLASKGYAIDEIEVKITEIPFRTAH